MQRQADEYSQPETDGGEFKRRAIYLRGFENEVEEFKYNRHTNKRLSNDPATVMAHEIECRILFALPPGYENGSLSKISTAADDLGFFTNKA